FLAIEAIPELLEAKKETFWVLDRLLPEAVLASNTSSLSIAALASATGRPDRVIGIHFFNPVAAMPLVEIVSFEATSARTRETAARFVAAIGKQAVHVTDSPGFATSRLGLALGLEAMRMVEEGVASAGDIDRAMELGYGHRMGPLKTTDLVGLDVRLAIAEALSSSLNKERFRPPEILRRMVAEGKTRRTCEGAQTGWRGKKPVEKNLNSLSTVDCRLSTVASPRYCSGRESWAPRGRPWAAEARRAGRRSAGRSRRGSRRRRRAPP